jgi:hypothetical protein
MGRNRRASEGEARIRMLVDHQQGDELWPANTVQSVDADTAAVLVGAGKADDHPKAVEAGEASNEHKAWQERKSAAEDAAE